MLKDLPPPLSGSKSLLVLLLLGLWMPLAMSAATDITISSASDWKSKCKGKSGEFNLKLTADITINTSDGYFSEFSGTFDGQGHTITLNTSGEDWALIEKVPSSTKATVKNLRLAGKQKVSQGTVFDDQQSPLIRFANGTVDVENCISEVEITVEGTSWGNTTYVGGFISDLYAGSTVNFTNCSSMVKFITTDGSELGGFVGQVDERATMNITNCHSLLEFSDWTNYDNKTNIGYFVGRQSGTLNASNCYARDFCLTGKKANISPTEKDNSKVSGDITAYGSFSSGSWSDKKWKTGEITYLLNNKSSDSGVAWVQTIGTDETPQLRAITPTSATVYYYPKTTVNGNEYDTRTVYYPGDFSVSGKGTEYKVTGQKNGRLTLSSQDDTDGRKSIIYEEENENSTVTFDALYYNQVDDTDTDNLLRGNSYPSKTLKKGDYVYDPAQRKFVDGEGKTIGQWECYLSGDGLTAESFDVPLGPIPVTLTATSIETQGLAKGAVVGNTPAIVGLPDDFAGTITYSSSNTDICTVDEDGTVTYTGESDTGEATITVNVPAFETWTAKTLTYTITFISDVSVSIPIEYTTFCSTYSLDFTGNEDVEAYTALINEQETSVILTKVDKVPAGAGVVLKKIGDNATATVSVIASAEALSDNQMVGVTAANTVDAATLVASNAYILSGQKFCKVASGATGYMAAGKAYLAAPASASAKSFTIDFATPTGVANVEASAEKANNVYYNIQGMRVAKPTSPGLYIINGKKVFF